MPPFGTLYPPETLLLHFNVGTAEPNDGSAAYELSNSTGGSPLIRSTATGRWWGISWQQLLTLARDAGIDAPYTPPEADAVTPETPRNPKPSLEVVTHDPQ
ncbi:MAG: hypothetical protein ACK4KV_09450 [Rhodocyclaceae bacterium]